MSSSRNQLDSRQRLPERTDCDIRLFDWGDTYRAAEVRDMKHLMRYGRAEFEKDWELAVALALIMASPSTTADFSPMLDECFMRIHAYVAIHPNELPFESRPTSSHEVQDLLGLIEGIKGGAR